MSKKTIAFLLKSPMQAWGIDSRFIHRTTFTYPTKSAVIGIICAAMGIDKYLSDANAKLKDLCECEFCAYQLQPLEKKESARFETIPTLSDFHTIGGGYNKSNPLHKGFALRKEGNKLTYGEAILTYRTYIQDSCFVALLTYPNEIAEKISGALKNPVWGVWLGRKSCIPSVPIFGGLYESSEDALSSAIKKLNITESIKYKIGSKLLEAESFDDTDTSIQDIPIDFRNRIFASRNVQIDPNADI